MPDFKARRKRLLDAAGKGGMDSVLLTDRKDIFYYCGSNAGSAFLHIQRSGATLFASVVDNAAMESADARVSFYKKPEDVTAHISGVVGIDYGMPTALFMKLRKLSKAKLKDVSALIADMKSVKDADEIRSMSNAVRLTRKAILSVDPWERKESDIASFIEMGFLKAGARRAFPIIVASGTNGYYIHHVPTGKRTSSPVIIDAGAKVCGYCADMTRTFVRGKEHRSIREDVEAMQKEILDFIHPGVSMKDVQKFWESRMKARDRKVMHAFGHGIGLDVHERVGTIREGAAIAIEPGIYIRGVGGWRVEDIAIVKKNGVRIL